MPFMLYNPIASSLAFAAAVASFSMTLVGAALAGPQVVNGIYSNGPAEPAETQYRQVGMDPSGQSALGGGFIEMLVTGADPSRRGYASQRSYEPPRQRMASAQPGQTDLRAQVDPIYQRTEVEYSGGAPGSIVVDTSNKFLYYMTSPGRAIRYGIGVGRPGFEWSGVKTISRKAEWPAWTPPSEMLARRPDLPRYMPGGPGNPLGARALYLGSSLYRIHGTNEPYTIGQNVSSGCIRMMNADVTDLYERVGVGTRVVVR
jgi:lipoprotein-anchoring transpeptidase ErfK/SrfK